VIVSDVGSGREGEDPSSLGVKYDRVIHQKFSEGDDAIGVLREECIKELMFL